jgi:hypothetical protein
MASATIFAFAAQRSECFISVHRLHMATLEITVATVEHLARLGEFLEICRHCVLDQTVGRTATLGSQLS